MFLLTSISGCIAWKFESLHTSLMMHLVYCKSIVVAVTLFLLSLIPKAYSATVLSVNNHYGILLDSGGLIQVYGKNEDRQHFIKCQANEVPLVSSYPPTPLSLTLLLSL